MGIRWWMTRRLMMSGTLSTIIHYRISISAMDRTLCSFFFESPKMLQEEMPTFIGDVPATVAALCQFVEFDTDVRTAPTTTSARAANHSVCTPKHMFSTRSGYRGRLLGQRTYNQSGMRVILIP